MKNRDLTTRGGGREVSEERMIARVVRAAAATGDVAPLVNAADGRLQVVAAGGAAARAWVRCPEAPSVRGRFRARPLIKALEGKMGIAEALRPDVSGAPMEAETRVGHHRRIYAPGLDAPDVPPIAMDARELRGAIAWTMASVDKKKSNLKEYAAGIRIEIVENLIRLVATDGRVLSLRDVSVKGASPSKVFVRFEAMDALMRLLDACDAEGVAMRIGEKAVVVDAEGIASGFRIAMHIEGVRYPDYERILSSEGLEASMVIPDRKELIALVRAAKKNKKNKKRMVTMYDRSAQVALVAKDNHLQVWVARSDELGDRVASVGETPVATTAPIVVGFNIEYLTTILSAMTMPTIQISWSLGDGVGRTAHERMVVLRDVEPWGMAPDRLHLLMPMRFEEPMRILEKEVKP